MRLSLVCLTVQLKLYGRRPSLNQGRKPWPVRVLFPVFLPPNPRLPAGNKKRCKTHPERLPNLTFKSIPCFIFCIPYDSYLIFILSPSYFALLYVPLPTLKFTSSPSPVTSLDHAFSQPITRPGAKGNWPIRGKEMTDA